METVTFMHTATVFTQYPFPYLSLLSISASLPLFVSSLPPPHQSSVHSPYHVFPPGTSPLACSLSPLSFLLPLPSSLPLSSLSILFLLLSPLHPSSSSLFPPSSSLHPSLLSPSSSFRPFPTTLPSPSTSHLGLRMVQIFAGGGDEPCKAFKRLLVTRRAQQSKHTLVHDCLRQHLGQKQCKFDAENEHHMICT